MDVFDSVLSFLYSKDKNEGQWRALLARINCFNDIVCGVGLSASDNLSIDNLMKQAVIGLLSAKSEVRSATIQFVVALEEMVGSTVLKYLDSVPTRTRNELENAIAKNHAE